MTDAMRKEHVESLLRKGQCKAEAFRSIAMERCAREITTSDFLVMADVLGFSIGFNEEREVVRSLMWEILRYNLGDSSMCPIETPAQA